MYKKYMMLAFFSIKLSAYNYCTLVQDYANYLASQTIIFESCRGLACLSDMETYLAAYTDYIEALELHAAALDQALGEFELTVDDAGVDAWTSDAHTTKKCPVIVPGFPAKTPNTVTIEGNTFCVYPGVTASQHGTNAALFVPFGLLQCS